MYTEEPEEVPEQASQKFTNKVRRGASKLLKKTRETLGLNKQVSESNIELRDLAAVKEEHNLLNEDSEREEELLKELDRKMTHFDLFKYMDQDPEKLKGRVKPNIIELIKKYRGLINGEVPTVTHLGYNMEGFLNSGNKRDIYMVEFKNGYKFPTLNNLGSVKFPAYVSTGTNFAAIQKGKLSIYSGNALRFFTSLNKSPIGSSESFILKYNS